MTGGYLDVKVCVFLIHRQKTSQQTWQSQQRDGLDAEGEKSDEMPPQVDFYSSRLCTFW